MPRSLGHRLRHLIKRIPGAARLYFGLRLLLAPSYHRDGLVTLHGAEFLDDPDFVRCYRRGLRQEPSMPPIHWRIHTLLWAARHAVTREGDFVECGVNRGFMSAAIMEGVDFASLAGRRFYLFDTYSGLVDELVTPDDKAAYLNEYHECYDFVRASFADFQNVHVVRGAVPHTLDTVAIEQVAYLHLDMNCSLPERAALEHFWPKLVSGAIVILDDYGWSRHEAQKRVADEFAAGRGVSVLSLPTGQGVLLKP